MFSSKLCARFSGALNQEFMIGAPVLRRRKEALPSHKDFTKTRVSRVQGLRKAGELERKLF